MKHLIIIGGGFAGAYIAKELEREFDVTLFDTKDYFEFTPSVLRTLVEPEHIRKIEVLHSSYLKRATIIREAVERVTPTEIIAGKKCYPFDYLVIASGSRYNSPIKEQDIIITMRGQELRNYANKLEKSKHVLIVGGGVVGTELAAEICEKYPKKEITLVHAQSSLLERNPPKARAYAEKFLKDKKVTILFNERVSGGKGKHYQTDKNNTLTADLVFLCTGIIPNSEFLEKDLGHSLNEKKFLRVNRHLQLEKHPTIFAAGDINDIKEEKTAQSAEKQAEVVCHNIRALEKKEQPQEYISTARPMVISLGKWRGILVYKNVVWTGIIPSFLKRAVEWKTMRRYRK